MACRYLAAAGPATAVLPLLLIVGDVAGGWLVGHQLCFDTVFCLYAAMQHMCVRSSRC